MDVPSGSKAFNCVMGSCPVKLRGGATDGDENTPKMVKIAIQNAASHGINLHHGVPNLANGDCVFESIADNISTRSCFNEVWNGTTAHNRKMWLDEAEDLVLNFCGMPEKIFREKWAILKIPGNYEFELGDFVLPAIAHCTRKDILIFNTDRGGDHNPIYVIESSVLGGIKANTNIPVLLAYNKVHYEGLVPDSEEDLIKTINLKENYITGRYTLTKRNIPILSSEKKDNVEVGMSYAEALKTSDSAKSKSKRRKKNETEDQTCEAETCSTSLDDLKNIKARNRTAEQQKRYQTLIRQKARSAQSENEKQRIREQAMVGMKLFRDKQTEPERKSARIQDKKAKILSRAKQTEEEQETVRVQKKETTRLSRAKQTEEERETVRVQKKETTRLSRAKQTEEERERVRVQKKEAMNQFRAEQAEEKKDSVKIKKKHDMKNSRIKDIKNNPLFKIAVNKDFDESSLPYFEYSNIGNLFDQQICQFCNAYKWAKETPGFCCNMGKIELKKINDPPEIIETLLKDKKFTDHIRGYNNALALASVGTEHKPEVGPNFKIQGKMHHSIGSLLPEEGPPKFAQIYFYDSDHELSNRLHHVENLNEDIIAKLQTCLHEYNPYIIDIKAAIEIAESVPECKLVLSADSKHKPKQSHPRTYNLPVGSEVAVLLPGEKLGDLDVILSTRGGGLQRINSVHRSYDPLHYVLLLPTGQDGFKPGIPMQRGNGKVSVMQFYAYHLQVRSDSFNILLKGHRLTQQYITDQFAKVERARMNWAHLNQKTIKAEKYKGLLDAHDNGDIASAGKRVILPPSISYSPRWYTERYQDAMTIVRHAGKPDLFVTFTCNPKWPEIQQSLHEGESAFDRPDICARVFNLKAKELIDDIVKNGIFGKTIAHVETIEWQKRKGLPHLHLLVTLEKKYKIRDATEIDEFISAEIPDKEKNPKLFEAVKNHMIHGPCGKLNQNSPCMQFIGNTGVKICSKEFPKAFQKRTEITETSYPMYMRRNPEDGGNTFELIKGKNSITVDNSFVVPYNPALLLKYDSHINIEFVTTVLGVKYLYKYISKGPDRTIVKMSQDVNEITQFLDCRYLSASESIWKLYGFNIHGKSHTVIKLSCHLESEQSVFMEEGNELRALLAGEPETTLTAFFKKNSEDSNAREILYPDFPSKYIWKGETKEWTLRLIGTALGRIPTVPFNLKTMELYSLRILLHHVKGARGFEELRTISGHVYPTFHAACIELGLMDNEEELDRAIDEAASLQFGDTLRNFFMSLLIYVKPSNPLKLWESHRHQLAADWARGKSLNEAINMTLLWLRDHLAAYEVSMRSLGLPEPEEKQSNILKIIELELNFNKVEEKEKTLEAMSKMNPEQKLFFDDVIVAINEKNGGLFCLDAPGGTGKTFVLCALLSAMRCDGYISLGTALSAAASKLLPNGSTLHSKLKVPIQIKETSLCDFSRSNGTGKLLLDTKLLIIDEVTMGHKFIYEAIDRSLKNLLKSDKPFGGLVTVFAGDWRQTLPIVRRGSNAQIISATLKFSYLWKKIRKYHLTTNMRVQATGSSDCNDFSQFLLAVGDGSFNGGDMIQIPEDMLLKNGTLEDLIDFVFPDLQSNSNDRKWLSERAILSPTNEQAKEVNDLITNKFPGIERVYKSSDTTIDMNPEFSPEFLNTIELPGMAPHCLRLKKGMLVMLMRNLNPPEGHCNGVKYIINNLLERVIEVTAVNGSNPGAKLFVPRIIMDNNDSTLPFTMRRRQYPLKPAFGMTANKSQGQTLTRVGIYLGQDFFSHGQLYVALSRCGNRAGIKIFTRVGNKEGFTGSMMRNCVFKEVLS